MLTMTQSEMNLSSALQGATEFYGYQSGPILLIITNAPVHSDRYTRIEARFAFMYTGDKLRKPTEDELKLFAPKA